MKKLYIVGFVLCINFVCIGASNLKDSYTDSPHGTGKHIDTTKFFSSGTLSLSKFYSMQGTIEMGGPKQVLDSEIREMQSLLYNIEVGRKTSFPKGETDQRKLEQDIWRHVECHTNPTESQQWKKLREVQQKKYKSILQDFYGSIEEKEVSFLNLCSVGQGLLYVFLKNIDLKIFSNLSVLDISSNYFLFSSVVPLENALNGIRVEKLNMSNCSISDENAYHFARVLSKVQIKELNLSYNDIGDRGAIAIAETLPKLTILDLEHNSIGLDGAKAIIFQLNMNDNISLNLANNCIGNYSLKKLKKILEANRGKPISIPANSNNLQELRKALAKSKITTLNLATNGIRGSDLKQLGKALKKSKITTLNLATNGIKGNDLKQLGKALPKTKLRKLDLSENDIEDEGMQFANNLKKSKLEEINLSSNRIGNQGVEHLLKALPKSKIKILNLSNNSMGFFAYTLPYFTAWTPSNSLASELSRLENEEKKKLTKISKVARKKGVQLNLERNILSSTYREAITGILSSHTSYV